MEITKVYGDRVIIDSLEQYKPNKDSKLEVIEYGGSLMVGKVFRVGEDCRYTEVGQKVLLQFPVGLEIPVDGKKYLSVRELDIIFTFTEGEA